MAALNPEKRMEAMQSRFDPANAADLVEGAYLVLECADSFAASYITSDLCLDTRQPLISASVVGRSGYVGGFCGGKARGVRVLFPEPPDQLGSCATDGVLGPTVGVVRALQVEMTIAARTGTSQSALGQLVTHYADDARFGGFRFDGAPDPAPYLTFIAASEIAADGFLVN